MRKEAPRQSEQPQTSFEQAAQQAEEAGYRRGTYAHEVATERNFAEMRRDHIAANPSSFETRV